MSIITFNWLKNFLRQLQVLIEDLTKIQRSSIRQI